MENPTETVPWRIIYSNSLIKGDLSDADLHILKLICIWAAHFILDACEKNFSVGHTEPLQEADFTGIRRLAYYWKI